MKNECEVCGTAVDVSTVECETWSGRKSTALRCLKHVHVYWLPEGGWAGPGWKDDEPGFAGTVHDVELVAARLRIAELEAALRRAHCCATLQDDGTCGGCFVSEALEKE